MARFFEQYGFNVGRGPYHESADALPSVEPEFFPVKFIAYYLPQFHAIPENDAWWGKGFTEWTNVTKAVPRFVGHRQPNLPADLGFYDLGKPETLRLQADLARRAGIYGFCIHNYWFGGRRILETPLDNLLKDPSIDLRFCLNWANENWSRRWDGMDQDILLEQRYEPGDDVLYAASILPALRDPRYIRIDGRPLLMVYRPSALPDAKAWVSNWRSFFKAHGVGDPYVVMAQYDDQDPRPYGMDAAAGFPPHNGGWFLRDDRDAISLLDSQFSGRVCGYRELAGRIARNGSSEYRLFPGVCPRWDNEARKPGAGVGFHGSSPRDYGAWLRDAAAQAMTSAQADERIVFVNAWNEWGEGAYLEPDRHYGYAYLAETRRVLDEILTGRHVPRPQSDSFADHHLLAPHRSVKARAMNFLYKTGRRVRGRLNRSWRSLIR